MPKNNLHWFAVYTKPRWEKKIAKTLDEKGIENYCPVNKVVKQWSDRKKVVLEPVFKSYVFVKISDDNKWDLKHVNGILNFVFWLGKPAVIKESEINTIKKFLNEFSDIQVVNTGFEKNTSVRVKQGVFMNYKGQVIEVIGNKAKVQIQSMGIILQANFEKKNLEIVHA
ncbi:UpxY family transcription antiterminator [Ferruginibacter sp. SUN002]|uniref:UpxY family transcription antiterminator n=1 Tax=Ferruginibacter sp. SUN002 TaxID=2937789 RepID=UPI003D3692A0